MTNDAPSKKKSHRRLWVAVTAIFFFLLVLVVPPLISVNHYKGQITSLMAQSLGRPVRLSSVEVRLLPWPGFVLTDLSVAEDPAYGVEPVLHANKVKASLRLLALWRGRLEIDKISLDEASLNLVRAAPGRWNLDPIFRTAAAETGTSMNSADGAGSRRVVRLPSLVATSSRINFKNGAEKLPFSLVNADISFWQASSGEWRIRLRGQPARTDVSLFQEETGVVRMEASVHSAPTLSQMPLNLDLNWREAQLGQLARLITGSDPGWRGDLTGDLHVDGTADAAQIAMRLRATGVHRAEFAPAAPLDFDANCGLVYHYTRRSLENLVCDSPLGDGRVRLTGQKSGSDAPPEFTVELDRIPVAAGLDALRALRNGLDPDLEASGAVSGKMVYAAGAESAAAPVKSVNEPVKGKRALKSAAKPDGPAEPRGDLTGSLTVTGFALSGGGLSKPLQAPKITFEPSAAPPGSAEALTGTVDIPAGGETPLVFSLRFSLAGYQVGVRGQAAIARARELAHAAGIPQAQLLAALAGDPLTVDLTAAGPWLLPEENSLPGAGTGPLPAAAQGPPVPVPTSAAIPVAADSGADSLTGTATLRNANWKADYLANHLEITEATLHLDGDSLRWDPVVFTYGPVKGTIALSSPIRCLATAAAPQPCPVQFEMQFADIDASLLESALLGAQQKATLLSDLLNSRFIARLHPSTSPPWPDVEGTIKADSLALGPVTLHGVSAELRLEPTGAEISSLDAGLFGGSVHLAGSLVKPASDKDKPAYTFEGDFQKLNVAQLGGLLGLRWSGAALDGNGKIELSGYTAKELAASARGTLHFECRRGAVGNQPSESSKAEPVPAALGRFDQWSGDAAIANGSLMLGDNFLTAGARKQSIAATITFGDPPVVSFAPVKLAATKHD
jgi:hypothetical protein